MEQRYLYNLITMAFVRWPILARYRLKGNVYFFKVGGCSVGGEMKRENLISNELKGLKLPSEEAFYVIRCYEGLMFERSSS